MCVRLPWWFVVSQHSGERRRAAPGRERGPCPALPSRRQGDAAVQGHCGVTCLLNVSADLNDISGDGIKLLNSIHPSDGRTRPGFQSGRGWGFLLESLSSDHTDKGLLLFRSETPRSTIICHRALAEACGRAQQRCFSGSFQPPYPVPASRPCCPAPGSVTEALRRCCGGSWFSWVEPHRPGLRLLSRFKYQFVSLE